MHNESITELVLGTCDGGYMNRVNLTLNDVLEKFVVENQFVTILSMRGMYMTEKNLFKVLDRFRESYVISQAKLDKIEEAQVEELN